MNIFSVGTLTGYVKNKALGVKWQQRKQEPVKTADEDPQIASLKRQAEDARKGQKISSLYSKMLSGMKLSDQEKEYLRLHSPDNYEKALQLEQEREAYKKELRQCTSKEDVEKLHQQKLTMFCSEAKAISQNPNIAQAKKREMLEYVCMRMNGAMNEYTEFKSTPEYHRLPERNEDDEKKKQAAPLTGDVLHLLNAITTGKAEKAMQEMFADIFSVESAVAGTEVATAAASATYSAQNVAGADTLAAGGLSIKV